MRRLGGAIAVWWGIAAILGVLVAQMRDWFVMTDELLYERLALSVDRLHSPFPHVHGTSIANLNQLYPLVLAPVLAHGPIGDAVRNAHVVGAFAMTSAAVPAYLIARRYVRDAWAVVAALLCVVVPWTVLASFLLTSVVAYPATLWAVLAIVATLETPTRRNDVLALLAVAVAVTTRTQLAVLGLVLLLALVVRRDVRRHPLVLAGAGAAVLLALVAALAGHNPLGTYGETAQGNPFPWTTAPAVLTHLAAVGIGTALVPFVLGGAWLAGELRRNAFALVGSLTCVLLAVEVASFDERFGEGLARDRYVAYLAPLFLIAFVLALARAEVRVRFVALATLVLALGLALAPLPVYDKLNVDAPVAVIDGYLRSSLGGLTGARAFLAAAAVLAAGLVATVWLLLPRRWRAAFLVVPVLALMAAETGYAFARLYRVPGTAGRPVTDDPSGVQAWIDRAVPRGASVATIPFPVVTGDYFSSAAYWWDVEFWNRSVDRTAGVPGEFEWTPSTFPKHALVFDASGRANTTLAGYVLQAVGDTRFHLAGTVVTNNRNAFLVEAAQPWRADWATTGLYDDGFTRPGVTAYVLVYPYAGQERPVRRTVTVSLFAPAGVQDRAFRFGTTTGRAGGDEVSADASVCVPAHGPGRLALTVVGSSSVPGDPTTDKSVGIPRLAGAQVSRIYLSGSVDPC